MTEITLFPKYRVTK